MRLPRRLGKFLIRRELLEERATALAIYDGVVVWEATPHYHNDCLEVYGEHPFFDEIAVGEIVPEYSAQFTNTSDDPPIREWVRQVTN